MPIFKRSSYYKPDYTHSAALIRARRPYLFKNIYTGLAIWAFVMGVYAFTIKAVGQEKFEDVIVPDEPARSDERKAPMPAQSPKVPNVAANGRTS
ncbi:MAG: hypothetical protein Q9227_004210 [Pyrenula ochraceoflavens]